MHGRMFVQGFVFTLLASTALANVSEPPLPNEGGPSADPPSWSRPGGYLGVGGTFALQDFDGSYDDSGSIMFRAGYRGLPNVGVEFLGEVLPEFDDRDSRDDDVSAFAVTVNGKLLLPLGRAEPYLMAGIGILDIDEEGRSRRDDFAFRAAGGLDFYLTPYWAIYGEAAYLLPVGEVDDFPFATFGGGLLFRF